MKKEKWFKLRLKQDLPRTTTKQTYKTISHWLRVCEREIRARIDLDSISEAFVDVLTYGKAVIKRE